MVTISVDVSHLVNGLPADANPDVTVPIANLKGALEDTLNGVQAFDRISFGSAESVTIASGVISPTKTHVVADTESAASTDDLDTINGGAAGRVIFLRCAAAARQIVIKHATGNIRTANTQDYILNNINRVVMLIHNGTNWLAALAADSDSLNLGSETTLTIASGVITRTQTRHKVDTESAAATDDLVTINGGTQGDVLELRNVSAARVVTVKNTGNIYLNDQSERKLTNTNTTIRLVYNGAYWVETQQAVIQRTPLSTTLYPSTTQYVPDRTIVSDGVDNSYRLAVLPNFEASNIILVQAAAATLQPTGIATPTIANTPANVNSSNLAMVTLPSTASAGNLAGFISTTFNLTRRQYDPVVTWLVETPADITALRYWLLLTSAAITNVDTIAAATEVAGFRFSTVAGDGGWRPVVKDATTQQEATAIGSVAASTFYMLRMRINSALGVAYFSVKTSFAAAWPTETTLSVNLPAAAQDLGFCVRVIPTTAAIRQLNFGRMSIINQ